MTKFLLFDETFNRRNILTDELKIFFRQFLRVPNNRPLPIVHFWTFFQPRVYSKNLKSEIENFSQELLSFTRKRVKVGWFFFFVFFFFSI